jgi:cob(I)alamin adenosyltransferase
MARIYTKTGDDGSTGLIGGQRISKGSLRVEAYGSVDELNAILGVVRSYSLPEYVAGIIRQVQDDLFTLGANLALPEGTPGAEWGVPPVNDEDVQRLERLIDDVEGRLEPLRRFVLPGGPAAGAMLHLARTVARRAERRCVALGGVEQVDGRIMRYLNRLSDLCFVLARLVNREADCRDDHPAFGK